MSVLSKYSPTGSTINERLFEAAQNFQTELTITEAKLVQVQAAFDNSKLECECLKQQNSSLKGLVIDLTNQLDVSRAEKVAFDLEKAVALASAAGEKLELSTANSRLQFENERLEADVKRLQLDVVKTVFSGVRGQQTSTAQKASLVSKNLETGNLALVLYQAGGQQTSTAQKNASLAHQSLALVPASKRNEEGQFKLYQNSFNRSLLTQALNITHRNLALPYTETEYLALVPYQAGGQQTSTAQKASLVSENLETEYLALVPYQAGGQQSLTAKNELTSAKAPVSAAAVATHTERTKGKKLVAGSVVILATLLVARNPETAKDAAVKGCAIVAEKASSVASFLAEKALFGLGFLRNLNDVKAVEIDLKGVFRE